MSAPNPVVLRLAPVDWRAGYDAALESLERADIGRAVDLLRVLALAKPDAPETWDLLATCHDSADDPVTAEALRIVGRTIASLQP